MTILFDKFGLPFSFLVEGYIRNAAVAVLELMAGELLVRLIRFTDDDCLLIYNK